jgi:hypothetical protein
MKEICLFKQDSTKKSDEYVILMNEIKNYSVLVDDINQLVG